MGSFGYRLNGFKCIYVYFNTITITDVYILALYFIHFTFAIHRL